MSDDADTSPIVFWSCAVVGGAICIYGLHGLIGALHGIRSRQFLQWFVGADITHDLIVAPTACLVGALIARFVPLPARAQVRAGFFATGIVLFVAWAPLHRYGHASAPGNSSVEPLDYTTAVATVLLVVWALAIGWFAVSMIRHRTNANSAPRPGREARAGAARGPATMLAGSDKDPEIDSGGITDA